MDLTDLDVQIHHNILGDGTNSYIPQNPFDPVPTGQSNYGYGLIPTIDGPYIENVSFDLSFPEIDFCPSVTNVMACVGEIDHDQGSSDCSSSSSSPLTMQHSSETSKSIAKERCIECKGVESDVNKRRSDRRREQNRISQRVFRARKDAKLSNASSRIAHLEAMVRALERTNIELKLTIEDLTKSRYRS